jgi:hypothetical protein
MPGWAIAVIVVAVAAVLFWLAWWSSGRAKPDNPRRGQLPGNIEQMEAEVRARATGYSGPGGG